MDERIMLFATILNGADSFEIDLQYRLVHSMISFFKEYEAMDMDEFSTLLDDVEDCVPVSDRKAMELVLQTKCFVLEEQQLRFADSLVVNEKRVTLADLDELFNGKQEMEERKEGINIEKTATVKGVRWCFEMVQLAMEAGMDGLPAFLRCEKQDSLIGTNVAGTATSDALSLLCSCLDDIKECGVSQADVSSSFAFLVKQVLSCQCRTDGWDFGGFFPMEDQPEAEHPTVDATCLAVMALCDFYGSAEKIEESMSVHVDVKKAEVADAVFLGMDFLFRMRQPEGSFGIYKFPDEYPNGKTIDMKCLTGVASPHENCTRMVLSTMGVCKGSGLFDEYEKYELYGKCSSVIKEAYEYLISHCVKDSHFHVWAPYFGDSVENYNIADVIVSTARVCRSLIPVWWQMEDERENIKEFYRDFFDFWKENEKKVRGKAGRYSFKTPGRERYSDGIYSWQGYAEMIAAFTILQGYNLFGMAFTKDEWKFIDKTVNDGIALQHEHGHWNAPGTSNPFCAATLAALEMLREYRSAKELG